jgi:hypothetical protein
LPVKASEPCSEQRRWLAVILFFFNARKNRSAATIGPIVCELDGPMPILNTSKMLRNITRLPVIVGNLAGFPKTKTPKATISKQVLPKAINI